MRLWDLSSGAQVCRLDGHADYVRAAAVAPNNDDTWATGERSACLLACLRLCPVLELYCLTHCYLRMLLGMYCAATSQQLQVLALHTPATTCCRAHSSAMWASPAD